MLAALDAAGGTAQQWKVRGDPRLCLAKLPGGAQPKAVAFEAPPALDSALSARLAARRIFAHALRSALGEGALVRLVRTPIEALTSEKVSAAARDLVAASTALYEDALHAGLAPDVCAGLLGLETVSVEDGNGTALTLLGPCHPLWLHQALLAAGAMSGAAAEPSLARSLLARSLEAPASPPTWPTPGAAPLHLGRTEARLLVYQREPDAVGGPALRATGKALLARYLDLCPHASLSTRVAILGGDPTELIGGMVDVLLDDSRTPGLARLEVATSRAPTLSDTAADAYASGALQLTGIPGGDEALYVWHPHLVIRFAPATPSPSTAVPGVPSATSDVGGGLLRTLFYMDRHDLQARTTLLGQPALVAVEALHAAARRRPPSGAFITDSRAVSLASVLPNKGSPAATWHVALGARLGGRAPAECRLLVHEAIDVAASCAVATREVRPAARAVAEGLRLLNIDEKRQQMLSKIANRLASASASGLISIGKDGTQLIASGVLALELRRRHRVDGACVVAQLDGVHYQAIVGEAAGQDRGGAIVLAAGARGGRLSIMVGYGSLLSSGGLTRDGRRLAGPVAQRLERVVRTCQLSTVASPLGAAAREALSWFLWPVVAAQDVRDSALADALRAWADGAPIDVSALALLPPAALPHRDSATACGAPLTLVPLDADLVNRLVLSDSSA